MKKFLKYLLKHIKLLIVGLFISFFFAYFIVDVINNNSAYYEATFEIENVELFDSSKLVDKNVHNEVKESGLNKETGENKFASVDVDKLIDKGDFSYTQNGNEITIKTSYKYYDVFFFSKINGLSTRAKTYVKGVVDKVGKDTKITYKDPDNIVKVVNFKNKLSISLIVMAISLVVEIIISIIFFKLRKDVEDENKCDNVEVFDSIFHKNYFKKCFYPLKKVKDITTIAMLFAIMLVCKFIPIPSGFGNLGLSFTYIFFATIAMIYGPIYGFVIGIFSDIIGFFINSTGMFNFGYTLQAALTGFIYGICLYRKKITFTNVLISRILVNYLMNVVLGSILFVFVFYYSPGMGFVEFFEKVRYYALLLSLPKNTVYLIPQSIILYVVLRTVAPILVRYKLVNSKVMVKRVLKNDVREEV